MDPSDPSAVLDDVLALENVAVRSWLPRAAKNATRK